MNNTAADYFTRLRSDFVPKAKDHNVQSRRPFNPGDPNEFLYVPAVPRNNTDVNAEAFSNSISMPTSIVSTGIEFTGHDKI